LERHAFDNTRLLGTFNKEMENWLDFYCYTALVDRDGKYQLTMLSHSGFKPLASSMFPMLQEEAFHLLTGFTGLGRVIKARKVPIEIVQKYSNRWFSSALDLFGVDHSSSASWFYVWGLKGRFDEHEAGPEVDRDHLNDRARGQYHQEVVDLIAQLNKDIPESQTRLFVPDIKFNRSIGEYKDSTFSIKGEPLTAEGFAEHLEDVQPGPSDRARLDVLFKERDWVYPVGEQKLSA
jgi:benzoyl-CoA 2,3-dioxygenase component B